MKRRVVEKIKVEKAKRAERRARYRCAGVVGDPKDLRGAKGALLENAAKATLAEEPTGGETDEQRYPPRRIRDDWP